MASNKNKDVRSCLSIFQILKRLQHANWGNQSKELVFRRAERWNRVGLAVSVKILINKRLPFMTNVFIFPFL